MIFMISSVFNPGRAEMSKLFTVILVAFVTASVLGQGSLPTVQLNNRIVGVVDAPVTWFWGPMDDTWKAELALISGPSATPLLPTTTFRPPLAGELHQYLNPVGVAIPGGVAGQQVILALRVFQGASYKDAAASGQLGFGSTLPVAVTLREPGAPGAELVGLQGFTFYTIPEPSVVVLGLFGVSALLLRRRGY